MAISIQQPSIVIQFIHKVMNNDKVWNVLTAVTTTYC